MMISRLSTWWEKHQIMLYFGAVALGGLLGLTLPGAADRLEMAINPALMALLYATFLAIPLVRLGEALRDLRFLLALCVLNFILVPLLVFLLSRFIAGDPALLIGVLLVLLAPCIDYVVVFSGLAGAAHEKLLAATPVLMAVQMLLIPVYLRMMAGPDIIGDIDLTPFLRAFIELIVIPLLLAALTQQLARTRLWAQAVRNFCSAAMVPLMMLTLGVIVASQIAVVRAGIAQLGAVLLIYVAFLLIMIPVGAAVGKCFGQGIPETRALVFSGATRNSLVVLPLALALPESIGLAAAVVVTQTLVELLGMIVYVRVVPRLLR